MPEEISLGALKSPEDYRKVQYGDIAQAISLPKQYATDLSAYKIWHQRKIGACTGHALAKAMQVYWKNKTGEVVEFSPRFLYAIAKCTDGIADEGTYPSLVAKILTTYGCATQATCPNDTKLTHEAYVYDRKIANIPKEALEEAKKYKAGGYAFVDAHDIDLVRQAIYTNGGVAILMKIGKEWWTDKKGNSSWDKKDILPLRTPEKIVSGHEVYLYGWDDATKNRLCNSWSADWADKGMADYDTKSWDVHSIEVIVLKDLPKVVTEEVKRLPKKPSFKFNVDLGYGMMSNPEVRNLQDALKYFGFLSVAIPSTGNYANRTREAVLQFQLKYKVDNETNLYELNGKRVGAKTRAKLNELLA